MVREFIPNLLKLIQSCIETNNSATEATLSVKIAQSFHAAPHAISDKDKPSDKRPSVTIINSLK